MLCHGAGDAVTVPALYGRRGRAALRASRGRSRARADRRWVVAPDTRHPWLPGADVLLWACLRAVREAVPRPPRGAPGAPGGA